MALCRSSDAQQLVTRGYVLLGVSLVLFLTSFVADVAAGDDEETCEYGWLNPDVDDLLPDLRGRIYGQPLAIELVASHIRKHLTNARPSKALVLSFHGPSGVGKTYMSGLVAKNMYKLGDKSKFVQKISLAHSYYDISKIGEYRASLTQTIVETLKLCPRSLFIIEEVDEDCEILQQLASTLKPFLDHSDLVGGVDSRKAVFILISNIGGDALLNAEMKLHGRDNRRWFRGIRQLFDAWFQPVLDDKQRQKLIVEEARGRNGFSTFVEKNVITEFVPFLPLRKKHVDLCIKDVIIRRNLPRHILTQTDLIHRELEWLPDDLNPMFSRSGCKKVDEKVLFILESSEKKMTEKLEL